MSELYNFTEWPDHQLLDHYRNIGADIDFFSLSDEEHEQVHRSIQRETTHLLFEIVQRGLERELLDGGSTWRP